MGNNPSKNNLSSGSSSCSNSSSSGSGLPSSTLAASDEEGAKPPPSRYSLLQQQQEHLKLSAAGSGPTSTTPKLSPSPSSSTSSETIVNSASAHRHLSQNGEVPSRPEKKLTVKPDNASYFNLLAHKFQDDFDQSAINQLASATQAINIGSASPWAKGNAAKQDGDELHPQPQAAASSSGVVTGDSQTNSNDFHTMSTTTDLSSVSSDFSSNSMLSTTPNSTHLDSSEDHQLHNKSAMVPTAGIASSSTYSKNVPPKGVPSTSLQPKSQQRVRSTLMSVSAASPAVVPNQTAVSSVQASASPPIGTTAPDSSNIRKLYNPKFNKKVINHYEIDIDSIIERLIEIGLSKSYSNNSLVIEKNEINYIISKSKDIFLSQPTLLELSSPIKVVGDLHGQFNDLLRILKLSGFPPMSNYLFLGDYVDRGKQSLETILLLLCFKIKYPNNFFMLRGNHESGNISKIYGFYDECKRRLGSVKLWKNFVDVFNVLPIAAIISDKIFCVHGGLSPFLKNLKQINKVKRPTDIPEVGLLSDLLWSDPHAKISDWCPNDRGISFFFGKKNVNEFLAKFKFDLIVRGHMVVEDGYEFFNKKKLVTVFSAPNYCGEFNNWGAVMNIDKKLLCSFELLKPVDLKKNKNKKYGTSSTNSNHHR